MFKPKNEFSFKRKLTRKKDILLKTYCLIGKDFASYFDHIKCEGVNRKFSKKTPTRTLIIIHAFWSYEFAYIAKKLNKSKIVGKVVVCVPFGVNDTNYLQIIETSKSQYEIIRTKNRGRDFGSFVEVISKLNIEEWDVVIKLHTKRSQWIWFKIMIDSLISSKRRIIGFHQMLKDNPMNLIAHPLIRYRVDQDQFKNEATRRLTLLLAKEFPQLEGGWYFPAGSMFATSGKFLKEYLLMISQFGLMNFEDESEYSQGSLAHTHERLVGLISYMSNGRIAASSLIEYLDLRALFIKLK